MAAKDLLPQMLELRRRNLTYKQIAEELKVSPSIVGKMLKEVRESPELALEFIELADFETGQTILSFTPEDFEKHRRMSTLYAVELRLYEIREGLIHSTEFTEDYWVESPPSSPISNWYRNLIKLYDEGVNWNEPIIKIEYTREIRTFSEAKGLAHIRHKLLEGLKIHIGDISEEDNHNINLDQNQINSLSQFIIEVLAMNTANRLFNRIEGLKNQPSELHWLDDNDLMEIADKLQIEITEFIGATTDPKKAINYCLPLIYKELTINELTLDCSNGWDFASTRNQNIHQIINVYSRFKELNISKETWDDMARLSINDLDYYLLISPWLEFDGGKIKQLLEGEDGTVSQNPKLDWPVRTFSTRYHQYTDGIEAEDNQWNHKLSNWVLQNIDLIIETAENLGWTVELVRGAIDLSEVFAIDLETVRRMSISKIQLAINSLKYCRKKGFKVNAGNLPWFEEHNWKVPKLKKGFYSYVGKEIYDMISEEVKIQKVNYLIVNEIGNLFNASKAPKKRDWRYFIRFEINEEPFDSICFPWNNYLGIKPCTPELFQMFSDSKIPLELIKDDDITNVLSAIENLKESNVEINAEIIEWASQKQWDISQLGQFETYRHRWLYHRLIEYDIPAVRMDKLLDEYNKSTEPGTNLASELELHEVLQQSPFKELCNSSSDGGMIFFDKDDGNSKVNSIIEKKIVVKNVVVEKKVYVEKDTISVQPLVDLEPYPLILQSDSDYAKRAVETIKKADLIGSINDVWRLLSIEAKTLFEDEIDRESNFNVILIDKLCDKLNIGERQHKKIHQLRRARNDFDKGKSESPTKPNDSLVISGLEIIEQIMSL